MDAKEEGRREQLMPLINRAYNEQDLETLERFKPRRNRNCMSLKKTATEKTKSVSKNKTAKNLTEAASELRFEINRLKAGRTYQLKQQIENAKKAGTDLLTTLAKDLERKIKASRGQLTRLMNMWHRAQ